MESLNDVVAQITGIRVRETVPDSILDRADDIEVIDLAPSELIQRLREGKVYVPKQAERAIEHYFSPGNLTALRELALRRTAQRVDEQLLTHMKTHAIPGSWPAGDRVLVCISEVPRCAALVRYTKRVADRLRAPWTALSVETLRSQDLSVVERDRIADTLRLAERLGGVAATLPGRGGRVADDVIDFPRANNVTQIVIGKSSRTRWFELLYGSVVHDLVRRSGTISVHVIAGDALKEEAIPRKTVRTSAPGANIAGYFAAVWVTAAGTLAAELLKPYFGAETVPLIYMMGVLSVAYLSGLGPSLFAAMASMLCYNFFFIPPIYSFTIADPANVAALFFFLFTALIVSHLTARVRRQAELARNRAAITSALCGFSSSVFGGGRCRDAARCSRPSESCCILPARRGHRESRPWRGPMVFRAWPFRRPGIGYPAGNSAPVPLASDKPGRHRCGWARRGPEERYDPHSRRAQAPSTRSWIRPLSRSKGCASPRKWTTPAWRPRPNGFAARSWPRFRTT